MLWFSVACFGVSVSVTFRFMCVHIISVRFRFLSGHLLGNIFSFNLTICIIYSYFPFGFLGLNLGSECYSS